MTANKDCAKCGGAIVAGDKFCATCGARVERTCRKCGTLLLPVDRFCPDCGNAEPFEGAPELTSVWDAVLRRLRSNLSGEYRITHELGRGGQAAVFLAEQVALKRQVAIKVLAPGSFTGESAVARFRREAQTIASLVHTNIVTIYSVGQLEELHYFVMQFVKGRSLADIIANRGQLPLTAVKAVAFQVGTALQFAHRRNVIHRDIKPANILFDEDGNAILTDFGIAKDVSIYSSQMTGTPLGTPAYMSPEQCKQNPISWASDQYSLGVLLYEMLTGRVPFEGVSFEVMQGHTDKEPPAIRGLRADCPVELEWAVLRMLKKRPDQRWSTMEEALDALGATPLTRDDPIRDELRELALSAPTGEPVVSTGPTRLSLRIPQELEVGESGPCELLGIVGQGTTPQLVDASWRVTDPGIAGFEGSPEVLVGRAPGTSHVIATSELGMVEGEVRIIRARPRTITLKLAQTTLEVGQVLRCEAEVRDRRGGLVGARLAWSSSDSGVASVTNEGSIRAVAPGSCRITVTCGDISAERQLWVQGAVAESIALSSPPRSIAEGEAFRISAQVFDKQGNELTGHDVQWGSSNPLIAKVDPYGVVTTLRAGTLTITARSGRATNSVALEVAAAPDELRETVPQAATPLDDEQSLGGAAAPGFEHSEGADAPRKPWSAILERVPRRTWIAVAGAGLLVILALGLWRGPSDTPGGVASGDPAALRRFLSPYALQVVDNASLRFAQPSAVDDFSDDLGGPDRSIVEGWLQLSGPGRAYLRPEWRLERGDFAAHLRVRHTVSGPAAYGGLMFGEGERADGRRTAYFVLLRGGDQPGFGVLHFDGAAYSELVRRGENGALRSSDNEIDLIVAGDTVSVILNGAEAARLALPERVGGGFGVFAADSGVIRFDDLAIAALVRVPR